MPEFNPLATYANEATIITDAQGLVTSGPTYKDKLKAILERARNDANSGKNRDTALDLNMVPTWSDSITGTAMSNVANAATARLPTAVTQARGLGWGMVTGGAADLGATAIGGAAALVLAPEAIIPGAILGWVLGQTWGYTAGQAGDHAWTRFHAKSTPLDAAVVFTRDEYDGLGDQLDKDHIEKISARVQFVENQTKKINDYLAKVTTNGGKVHRCGQAYDFYRGVTYVKNEHALAYKELSYLKIFVDAKLEVLVTHVDKMNAAMKDAAKAMAGRANDLGLLSHTTCDHRKCVKGGWF